MKNAERTDEACFIVGQFLHYNYAMQPERLTEQERTVLILYYCKLIGLLKVLNDHRGFRREI